MEPNATSVTDPTIDALFGAGAHYGYRRSKRHPTAAQFIFGVKGGVEIFDLEKTSAALAAAEEFVRSLARLGKTLLLVGGKREASDAVREGATRIGMPFVAGRWVGGTLTNFGNIRKRIETLLDLTAKREKGELVKYTKKERLLIDRQIARLQELFGGLIPLGGIPGALFVVDPGREHTAVTEARKTRVPIVALASSDCDFEKVEYAIPGNDAARASIAFFVNKIVEAYEKGRPASNNQ